MRELLAYGRRTRLSLRPLDLSATVVELEGSLKRLLPSSIEMALAIPNEAMAVSADPDVLVLQKPWSIEELSREVRLALTPRV